MNVAEWSIKNKVVTLTFTVLIIGAGILAYESLGRLEDPEFTIKDALVTTLYPGASPMEVEEEVTEVIATAIQELGQLKRLTSISRAGSSIITVTIEDKYDKHSLPQVWDELRRKVGDVQSKLPPGVLPSIVADDYGDVFGVIIALHGNDYSYKELNDFAKFLRREFLQVKDVAKVIVWGKQQEQVFVEIPRARMATLGIGLDQIYATLQKQNLVANSGSVRVGPEYIYALTPTGEISSVDKIAELIVSKGADDRLIYLKDIATIHRGYVSPPTPHLRFDGDNALALGISTSKGGNVVTMGEGIVKRLTELQDQIPTGIEMDYVYLQAEAVEQAVNSFIISLAEAIAIVIAVLMIFMGLRSGILIGAVLLITVW